MTLPATSISRFAVALDLADGSDTTVFDRDIAVISRRARAVDDLAVAEN